VNDLGVKDGSELGRRLRAARERRGMSREVLAVRSKLSWSAIAQVESGRRRNLRPGTLVALTEALGVTLDYLVHGVTESPAMLEHHALIYETEDELVEIAVPFLTEGIERSEAVLVVVTKPNLALLRRHLGPDAERVEFVEAQGWYGEPGTVLRGYRDFVSEKIEAGAPWVRILGELVWEGKSPAEVSLWTRYESFFNVHLAASPVSVVCLYDTTSVPPEVAEQVRLTHPRTIGRDGIEANSGYADPARFVLES
jgi:transcriptional regulator with XRE-family HTH domain